MMMIVENFSQLSRQFWPKMGNIVSVPHKLHLCGQIA